MTKRPWSGMSRCFRRRAGQRVCTTTPACATTPEDIGAAQSSIPLDGPDAGLSGHSKPRRARRVRSGRRRTARAVLLTVVLFTALNTGLEAWQRSSLPTTTTLSSLPPTGAQAQASVWLPHTYWVFFPGFGIDYCRDVEASLAEVVHQSGQSFCVAPSPVSLDPDEIAAAIRSRVDQARGGDRDVPVTLHLYGISMGGMLAYDVAQVLHRDDLGIEVDSIVFDSSPAGPHSVSGFKQLGPRWAGYVTRVPNLPGEIPNPLEGGPLSRTAFHLLERAVANMAAGQLPLTWPDVNFSWYLATSVSARGVTNQLHYIESFFPRRWPSQDPAPAFAYLRAENAGDDTTVDVDRAIETYRELVEPHRLWVYSVSGGRHASADSTAAGYRAALQRFITDARMRTVSSAQATSDQVTRLPFPWALPVWSATHLQRLRRVAAG